MLSSLIHRFAASTARSSGRDKITIEHRIGHRWLLAMLKLKLVPMLAPSAALAEERAESGKGQPGDNWEMRPR